MEQLSVEISIGHFRITFAHLFKTRPSNQPFVRMRFVNGLKKLVPANHASVTRVFPRFYQITFFRQWWTSYLFFFNGFDCQLSLLWNYYDDTQLKCVVMSESVWTCLAVVSQVFLSRHPCCTAACNRRCRHELIRSGQHSNKGNIRVSRGRQTTQTYITRF